MPCSAAKVSVHKGGWHSHVVVFLGPPVAVRVDSVEVCATRGVWVHKASVAVLRNPYLCPHSCTRSDHAIVIMKIDGPL